MLISAKLPCFLTDETVEKVNIKQPTQTFKDRTYYVKNKKVNVFIQNFTTESEFCTMNDIQYRMFVDPSVTFITFG